MTDVLFAPSAPGARRSPTVVVEWDVAPGDRLRVTGLAERGADGLVIRAHDPGKGDLVLCASDAATRSRTLGRRTSQMLVALVLCLALLCAGVACLAWELRG